MRTLTPSHSWSPNHNSACGNGCVLQTIEGAQFALGGLPSPEPGALPHVQFVNTSTGLPLGGSAGGGGATGAPFLLQVPEGQPLSLEVPSFSQDLAVYVEWA